MVLPRSLFKTRYKPFSLSFVLPDVMAGAPAVNLDHEEEAHSLDGEDRLLEKPESLVMGKLT